MLTSSEPDTSKHDPEVANGYRLDSDSLVRRPIDFQLIYAVTQQTWIGGVAR